MSEEAAELQGESLPEESTGDAVETEDSATSTPEDTSEAPKKGVAKRIDELVGQRNQEREEKEWFRKQFEQLQERVNAQQQPSEPETPAPVTKPEVGDFESYDAYLVALSDYTADQKFQAWKSEQEQSAQRTQAEQRQQEFNARVAVFEQEHSDFQMKTASVPFNEGVYEVVSSSEEGPRLLYHLGSNPEEAARITSLPPVQAAMELGRLEASLARPSRNQTSAPDPVEPLSGGSTAQATDPSKMSADEWRDWRNQQEAERRK